MSQLSEIEPGLMVNLHSTHCKFCQKPLTLEIAEGYDAESDPHKLIRFAACNRCADIRMERRRLENQIGEVCARVMRVPHSKRDQSRDVLTKLTQNYANLIARWHYKQGGAWHEDCVNLLLEKPESWNKIVGTLWQIYRDWAKSNP